MQSKKDIELQSDTLEIKDNTRLLAHEKLKLHSKTLEIKGNAILQSKKDIELQSDTLEIKDNTHLLAHEKLELHSNTLEIKENVILQSKKDIELYSLGKQNISGKVSAGKRLKLKANNNIELDGLLQGKEELEIQSDKNILILENGQVIGEKNVKLIAHELRNRGQLISEQAKFSTYIRADFYNYGIVATGTDIEFSVKRDFWNFGLTRSIGNSYFYIDNFYNQENAQVLSKSSILFAKSPSKTKASNIFNHSARIEAENGDISFYSLYLENKRLGLKEKINYIPNPQVDLPNFRCQESNCYGNPTQGTKETLKKEVSLDPTSDTSKKQAKILAGGNVIFHVNRLENLTSMISSLQNIEIHGDTLKNQGLLVYKEKWKKNWAVDFANGVGSVCVSRHRICAFGQCVDGGCANRDVYYAPAWQENSGRLVQNVSQIFSASIQAKNDIIIRLTGGATLASSSSNGAVGQANVSSLNQAQLKDIKLKNTKLKDIKNQSYITFDFPSVNNYLFVRKEIGHKYLVETNPIFTDINQFFGSDYFYERSGYSTKEIEKMIRLGDPAYEKYLIEEQILEKTGHRFLSSYGILDSNEQVKILFDQGLEAKEDLTLTLGIALKEEQLAQLKKDIVWMIEKEIEGKKVLVPQVYFSKLTEEKTRLNSTSLSAKNIDWKGSSIINHGGSIIAQEDLVVEVTGGNIENIEGTIEGNRLLIRAKNKLANPKYLGDYSDEELWSIGGNLKNLGGSIKAYSSMLIDVDTNLYNESIVERLSSDEENFSDHIRSFASIELTNSDESTSNTTRAFSENDPLASILGNRSLQILSGNDIKNKGAQINSSGATYLKAENDLLFDPLALAYSSSRNFTGGYETGSKLEHKGSSLSSKGDLKISTGGDLVLMASHINSEASINLDIQGDTYVLGALDIEAKDKQSTKTEKKGDYSHETIVTKKGYYKENVKDSSIQAGGNLNINFGGNVLLAGSDLLAKGNLNINGELVQQNEKGEYLNQNGELVGGVDIIGLAAKEKEWHSTEKTTTLLGVDANKFSRKLGEGMNFLTTYAPQYLPLAMLISQEVNDEADTFFSNSKKGELRNNTHHKLSSIEAGASLNIDAKNDIWLQASSLSAGEDINISTEGELQVETAIDTFIYEEYEEESKFHDFHSAPNYESNQVKYTSQFKKTTIGKSRKTVDTKHLSSFFSAGGDINIQAKKDIDMLFGLDEDEEFITGGLMAGGDIFISSKEGSIDIFGVKDKKEVFTEEKSIVEKFSFSIGNAILEAGREVYTTGREIANESSNDQGNESEEQAKRLSYNEKETEKNNQEESNQENLEPTYKNPHKDKEKVSDSLNFLNSLKNLSTSFKRASASEGTYGFYTELSLERQENKLATEFTQEIALPAFLYSQNGNILLEANKKLDIQGIDLIAENGDITLIGKKEINIMGLSQDIFDNQTKETKMETNSLDSTGTNRQKRNETKENFTQEMKTWRNSRLSALNGKLQIISDGDAYIEGVNAIANDLSLDIKGTLHIESLQDKMDSNLEASSSSFSWSTDGTSQKTYGSSWSHSQGEGEYRWVGEQTSLVGTNSLNINTNYLKLIGAKIANEKENQEGKVIDGANLKIIANKIEFQDIKNLDRSFYEKMGAGSDISGANLSYEYGFGAHEKEGILYATLGQGDIQSLSKLSTLNRDINLTSKITKNEIYTPVSFGGNLEFDMLNIDGKYFENIIDFSDSLVKITAKVSKDLKKLEEMKENFSSYGIFNTKKNILEQLIRANVPSLNLGEQKLLEDLFANSKEDNIHNYDDTELWLKAVWNIPVAGKLLRDNFVKEMMEGDGRFAYERGNYEWLKGTNQTRSIHNENGTYYEIIKEYNPNTGGWDFISKMKTIKSNYEQLNPKGNKGTPTWCNTYASHIASSVYGLPSLQSFNNPRGWNANQIYDNLKKGYYNNADGNFKEIKGWQEAESYASKGYFVVSVYKNRGKGSGHIAIVTGGYDGLSNLANLNISQAGARTGNMTHLEGFGRRNQRKTSFYAWKRNEDWSKIQKK